MRLVSIILVVLASGCRPPQPRGPLPLRLEDPREVRAAPSDRFSLELLSVFHDDLAFGDERGVYILREKATGREWIGVSGVGISELGDHPVGKTRAPDER